jgi:hypothetical protein
MQQQVELADAAVKEGSTSDSQAAPAAPMAAAAKSKLPQQQPVGSDTAAAGAGMADNAQQQQPQQLQRMPATPTADAALAVEAAAADAGGSSEGGKQSSWLWRVCSAASRLSGCVAESRLSWQDGVLTVELVASF